jgi:UDP-N-acetylglucosamine 2-epimerase
LKFRALSIRYSIERQEATESGFTPIVGLDIDKILNLINFHDSEFSKLDNSSPKEYKINNTSKRFLNILLGSNYK